MIVIRELRLSRIIKQACLHRYQGKGFSWMSHVYYIFLIDLYVANPDQSHS